MRGWYGIFVVVAAWFGFPTDGQPPNQNAAPNPLTQEVELLRNIIDSSLPVVVKGGQKFGNQDTGALVPFSDKRVWNYQRITGLVMRCADRPLSLQVRYGDDWAPNHGYWNPLCSPVKFRRQFNFSDTEFITSVVVHADTFYVNSVTFITNQRHLPVCGDMTNTSAPITESGDKLEYISGATACWFDQLRFHWNTKL